MRYSLKIAKRFFALGLLLASLAAFAAEDDDAPEPAPRFHAKTLAGETFTNQSIRGKVVLLEFWTTWCPYCQKEEPIVEALNHEYSDKSLIVLAIDVGESKKTVVRYLAEHPRSCRIVLTGDTNLAAMYEANSYPIYVVIDRDGNIAATQRGAGGEGPLRDMLKQAGLGSEPRETNQKASLDSRP